MVLQRSKGSCGTLVVLEHTSKILKGNPLRDPHVHKPAAWLPRQYDSLKHRCFPVLYDLAGFTGSGLAHTNWKPLGDNVPERVARWFQLVEAGKAMCRYLVATQLPCFYRQDVAGRIAQQIFGDASQKSMSNSGPAMGSNY